jgi:peptidoglycan/LPS O-acetylase OafA/YrhL
MQEFVASAPISVCTEKTEKQADDFKHMPALDGVRALAIIVVMIYHLEWITPSLHSYVKGGFLGVDIFFVLSGFLITSILLNEHEKTATISLKNFYLRRFLRLIPAFWFFLICLYLFGTHLLPQFQADLIFGRHDFIYALTYTMNWFSATNPGYDSNLNHAWSLSIEEQFYIIWSLVLFKAFAERQKRKTILLITIGFIVAVSVSRAVRALTGTADTRMLYYATDTRIDSLLIGCVTSMIFVWKMLPAGAVKKFGFKLLLTCSTFAGAFVLFSFSHDAVELYVVGLPTFNIAVAIGIFWLVSSHGTTLHKFLENRFVGRIGNISYALYLWHYLMYEFAKKEFATSESRIFVGLSLAIAMACISYYLIEKPFLKLKNKFNTKPAEI